MIKVNVVGFSLERERERERERGVGEREMYLNCVWIVWMYLGCVWNDKKLDFLIIKKIIKKNYIKRVSQFCLPEFLTFSKDVRLIMKRFLIDKKIILF